MAYCPDEGTFYTGTDCNIQRDGFVTVYYDDGDVELLNMDNETCTKEPQFFRRQQ